jgi:histidinol dehydrogenase
MYYACRTLTSGGHDEKGTVYLVSQVQQSFDQAKDEVQRNIRGIKRKRANKAARERRRKQIENVKKVSKKKK